MGIDERHRKISEDEVEPWKYLMVIWKRRTGILFVTLFCALFAGVISFLLPKSYQSELLLKVGRVGNVGTASTLIENEMTVVGLIKSEPFLITVINKNLDKWGKLMIPKELNVKATIETNTQMIRIRAEGKSPQQTVEIVNAIANEVILRHKGKFDSAIAILKEMEKDLHAQSVTLEKDIDVLRKIITRVDIGLKDYYQRVNENLNIDLSVLALVTVNMRDREAALGSLKQKEGDLKLATSAPRSENTMVTDPPTIPKNPVRPKKAVNVEIGALIGLLVSVFLVFVLESLDSRKATRKAI